MLAEGRSGDFKTPSGITRELRLGPFGDLVVNDIGLGRYFEQARLGRLFTTVSKAVTVAATHNSPLAAVTATTVLGFQNPQGNNKAAALIRCAVTSVSGTPAGGQVVLNVIPAVTTATTATKTGSANNHLPTGPVTTMFMYNNVALTALAPVVATELSIIGGASAAAVVGTGGPNVSGEDLGGQFIIPPGTFCAIMAGSGAGTSWIVNASLTWAEIDWPLP